MDFKNKYLKYKKKYLKLKNELYGGDDEDFLFRIFYHYKGDLDLEIREYLITKLKELYGEIEIIDEDEENELVKIIYDDYKSFVKEKNVGLENYNYLILKPKIPEELIRDDPDKPGMNDLKLTNEEYKTGDKFSQENFIKLIPPQHGIWQNKNSTLPYNVAIFGLFS